MARRALGIDVASREWRSNGSALVEFEDAGFTRVVPGAVDWPSGQLTPRALADAIDTFARREGVCAVALDGPQGWRDPATPPALPGVGRRCEYLCKTQGKTGVHPVAFPKTQRAWIEFCVELFAELLARPGVALAEPGRASPHAGYVVLECFPTSVWRSSGLSPLPARARHPELAPFARALAETWRLPAFDPRTHDDLQAVVAALTAVAAAGGPAVALPRGVAGALCAGADGAQVRIEGFIWDAKPTP